MYLVQDVNLHQNVGSLLGQEQPLLACPKVCFTEESPHCSPSNSPGANASGRTMESPTDQPQQLQ